MNKKDLELFLSMKDEIKECLQYELEQIEKDYGFTEIKDQMLMLQYFLYNCHDIISSIAEEFTNGRLSKSTYSKQVYLSEIQSAQKESYETMFFEDIEDYVACEHVDGKIDAEEFMDFLKGYFSNRDTFREDLRDKPLEFK